MAKFERTITVHAPAEQVFDYVSQISNLPDYMDQMTAAEPGADDTVKTTAVIDTGDGESQTVQGEAWFRVDDQAQRIEWGSEGENDYHGELSVTAKDSSTEVSMTMHTNRAEQDDVNEGIDQTLKNISDTLESN